MGELSSSRLSRSGDSKPLLSPKSYSGGLSLDLGSGGNLSRWAQPPLAKKLARAAAGRPFRETEPRNPFQGLRPSDCIGLRSGLDPPDLDRPGRLPHQQGLCEARLGYRDGSPQLGAPGPGLVRACRHCIIIRQTTRAEWGAACKGLEEGGGWRSCCMRVGMGYEHGVAGGQHKFLEGE